MSTKKKPRKRKPSTKKRTPKKVKSGGRKAPKYKVDDAKVQRSIQNIFEAEQARSVGPKITLEQLKRQVEAYEDVAKEVLMLDEDKVRASIEIIITKVATSILKENGLSYSVPSRSSNNQKYVAELDRIVLLGRVTERVFSNVKATRKTAITTRILQLVYEICSKRIHVTKRDLFYTDVKLFIKQDESDNVLDDLATMVGCTRSSLNVVASEKGVVLGQIQFKEAGDDIDCTKMGIGGKSIPPFIDRITHIRGTAKFILLVEKDAAFMRLAEDRFYNKYHCIIITAKGQPDVATRLFLRKIKDTLKIPVLGLVDSDPYGLKILSVYMTGSKNMSYDSAHLTTPDIKWLGVRPSDLETYNIPEQCRLDMTEHDMRTGRDLMKEEFIIKNPDWLRELELMLKMKKKAEIQALSNFGFQYLTEEYLPRKLAEQDWF